MVITELKPPVLTISNEDEDEGLEEDAPSFVPPKEDEDGLGSGLNPNEESVSSPEFDSDLIEMPGENEL